jgi:putative hydrolase of the HAD superfamily
LPVVVFDGDDTLWSTEPLYDRARQAARKIVDAAGLDAETWWEYQLRVDVHNVEHFGLSAERFPTSSVDAYEKLAAEAGRPVDAAPRDSIWSASASVFEVIAPIHPQAHAVLQKLQPDHRLVLLTQGDPRVQVKRIEDSGLGSLFDQIIIVAMKSSGVLGAIVDQFHIPHDNAWMVGNSIPSDINPAVAVGMRAIWVDAHVWSHERREQLMTTAGHVNTAADLSQVPDIIRLNEHH